ncbi:amidohydrolase family protein [Microbacterium yannicii]|uniref:amidohydrolase family protein n=1 Tax=Microbacterium yannicii TaxID=671622 RepID=UPI00031CBA08|nr:amidohydrolase family protein [Microbacterium yannicii]
MSDYLGNERILIRGGTIISVDEAVGDLPRGDVLIDGGMIVAIGVNLPDEGARVIDADNHYVLPGFVDTHRHTWQSVLRNVASDWSLGQYFQGMHFGMSSLFRPEDTYIGNLLGRTEALDGGITTMLDWSHNMATPEHADAAVAGLLDAPGRSVFAHGGGAPQWQVPSGVPHPRDVLRLQEQYFSSENQLVTLQFAARGPQYTTPEIAESDWELAREVGTRITVHVGDGAWGKNRHVVWMHDRGMTGPDVTYVHCNMIDDEEFRIIADTGGSASVAADIETQMGHGWPATGRLLDVGVRPSLSIDVCSSNGGDMFHAMKTTISTQRALDNAALERNGLSATDAAGLRVSCRDVIEFATLRGAIANGVDDKVGSLTVGKQADIILIRASDLSMFPHNNPYGQIVYNAHAGMVDTILIAGRVVKEEGRLIGTDVGRIKQLAQETNDYLFAEAANKDLIRDASRDGHWHPRPVVAS